jgi:hypothetical protein
MGWERKGREKEVSLFGLTEWELGRLVVCGLWCVGREVKGVYMAWQGKGKGRSERDYYKKFLTTFCVSVSWVRVLC